MALTFCSDCNSNGGDVLLHPPMYKVIQQLRTDTPPSAMRRHEKGGKLEAARTLRRLDRCANSYAANRREPTRRTTRFDVEKPVRQPLVAAWVKRWKKRQQRRNTRTIGPPVRTDGDGR